MREPDTPQNEQGHDEQGRKRAGTPAVREQPSIESQCAELAANLTTEPVVEPIVELTAQPIVEPVTETVVELEVELEVEPADTPTEPRTEAPTRPPIEIPLKSEEAARLAVVQAGGWLLTLAIVGLWIGASQFWRRTSSQPAIVQAEYKVDVNQARERDLLNLPEVGPALAKSILAYRAQHGNFHSLSEFGEVPGVGPQTLKQLAPFLYFADQPDGAANETLEDTADDTLLTAQRRERIAP